MLYEVVVVVGVLIVIVFCVLIGKDWVLVQMVEYVVVVVEWLGYCVNFIG